MYSPIQIDIHATANILAYRCCPPTPDGLVMRVGEGWERNNAEAIASWIRSRSFDSDFCYATLQGNTADEAGSVLADTVELLFDELCQLLRGQAEQIWDCPNRLYPTPKEFMPRRALTSEEEKRMVHALQEILGTGHSIAFVNENCHALLPGEGSASQKILRWLRRQAPRYSYHPSEMTLALAHELVRVLYPDFEERWG